VLVQQALHVLRSNEYFGQYGKISKVFLRKTPSDSCSHPDSILGIYITYLRREDAARAISALDGYQAPNNPGKVLKATYGTTKYCLYFLRGLKCEDGGGLGGGSCLGLHEMAGEGDIFTRKDMSAL
jgi:CCR4-NOT transcription complex subunit 4